MKLVIQRVRQASVSVAGEVVSSIGRGLCVLVGIHKDDTRDQIEYMVRKVLNLRMFEDQEGKRWDKSVLDLDLEVLCVSQFTLYHVMKGNKLDFSRAMGREGAENFYSDFLKQLRAKHSDDKIKDGVFGAMMDLHIVNDGPVTITLDSPIKDK